MYTPCTEDKRMGHNDVPLAGEGDVSIISVGAKLCQLCHHHAGVVQAHVPLKCYVPPSAICKVSHDPSNGISLTYKIFPFQMDQTSLFKDRQYVCKVHPSTNWFKV